VIEETTAGHLPPMQYLMMEVLAARYRLGEIFWTFPRSYTTTARALQIRRLVTFEAGVVPDTIRVRITKGGLGMFLEDTYATPKRKKK
jgi:hypothetical protein